MKRFLSLFLFMGSIFVYAEKAYYSGVQKFGFKTVVFNANGVASFDDVLSGEDDIWNQSFKYKFSEDGKFYALTLENENQKKSFLALKSDFCLVLYDSETFACRFFGMAITPQQTETVYFPEEIKASSELKENNTVYAAENLSNVNSDSCWCEGVEGSGIGQSVRFSANASSLIILTGYISAKKKYLFEENCRPKRITVNFTDIKKTETYNLLDSPNPQIIDFKMNAPYSGVIEIIIDEVYEGTKYKDTCISSIICKYL